MLTLIEVLNEDRLRCLYSVLKQCFVGLEFNREKISDAFLLYCKQEGRQPSELTRDNLIKQRRVFISASESQPVVGHLTGRFGRDFDLTDVLKELAQFTGMNITLIILKGDHE